MLPKEFKERMMRLLGDESNAFFEELENREAVRAFRVNGIKCDEESFEAFAPEIERTPARFPKGAYYTEESHPGSLACHHSGMIYMQDLSAMATVCAVKVEEGMKVLDSCSAPGGKTGQLASLVGNNGIVVANEYEAKRCRILQGNIERMGCRNTVVVNLDTAVLAETYPDTFDIVLCDAPCSGEGMFRKNEQTIDEWSLQNVLMCAERQREILTNVQSCVAVGGLLLYSTCTFSLEENEMNVDWFLNEFPNFELCRVEEGLAEATAGGINFDGCKRDMSLTRRFYPHVSSGEGQFIAVMRKLDSDAKPVKSDKKAREKKNSNSKQSSLQKDALAAAREFIEQNLEALLDAELEMLGDCVYLKPDIALPPYGIFAAGVCVGQMQGKRLVPHHQLFSAYGTQFKRRVELKHGDSRTYDYLKGLEIKVEDCEIYSDKPEGWAAVIIDGCATGGGKISGGICKNHYPKGLRNKQ